MDHKLRGMSSGGSAGSLLCSVEHEKKSFLTLGPWIMEKLPAHKKT